MKSLLSAIVIAGLTSLSAYAQNVPTEYNFKLKAADVDKLGKALGAMPYVEVADLMASLRQQIVEQQQASQAPKAEGGVKEEKK